MMSTVIKVENLGKRFFIGQNSDQRNQSFREALTHAFKRKSSKKKDKEFWALRDISFEVKQGERIGIIGRNGAGKSTLLKILSRITEPTTGKVRLKGRVASLLEVGTGFHPELTGRENIFLNGAILGMSRHEIKRKFDEIVSFAEVEQFLDTPVKRYSSGMYVRLAFSVAAHLEPEILIVDEVLAVGDAQFQKKCLNKMENVGKEGRTVLFVSHNINAIENLCNTALLLKNGQMIEKNSVDKIVRLYSESFEAGELCASWIANGFENRNEYFCLKSLRLIDTNHEEVSPYISRNDTVYLEMIGNIDLIDPALTIGYVIYNENYQPLYWSYQTDSDEKFWPVLRKGENKLIVQIPTHLLNEGRYFLAPIGGLHYRKWIFEPNQTDIQLSFEIQGKISNSPFYQTKRPTLIAPIFIWNEHV